MSMISAQIDELRKSADEWNRSNMFELARMCSEAADTIWQLRDDLQRANAENAKLRELCGELLRMAESHDPDVLHWPEIHNELRELGIEVGE